ncbi:glycosyl transferase [Acidihalobacter aeolianus]|uniref:Glycosyl transferase n=1 Tax=Acidihalobacter aeolianus TaxID=2792603 RepID=A0A1D8K837_9GAMM|nr:glycosyltransferase family 4 protein [Acidihalobacter aeolianus]AOV17139.1 glycosyl transferase [Acidihalobacter aeolianus]
MKIAYLCADGGIPVLGHKGASVHVREMIGAFTRTGHEVSLFCSRLGEGNAPPPGECMELPPQDDPEPIANAARDLGIETYEHDRTLRRELARIAHDRALAARMLGALQRSGQRPELLYERYSLMHRAGLQVAAALDIPHILEINAPLVEEQARFRGLVQRGLAESIEREVFRGASHIVAVSAAMKTHAIKQGVPEQRISILPNGVDTTRFNTAIDKLLIRARHGFSGSPVIGFVGSLKPWHGLDLLLDAFHQIRREHGDARLLIVGDGPVMEHLRERIMRERMGNSVVLAGHVPHDEIPAYLAAMDVTVAPYQPQPDFYFSPMKVIESMAMGRPVVAPRIGQLTELVEDGVTGRLYSPGDTAGCAAAISELLQNPLSRRAMGEQAARRASTAFSWDSNAARVASLAAQMCPTHAGPLAV